MKYPNNKILKFLNSRPAIAHAEIARQIGMSRSHFSVRINGGKPGDAFNERFAFKTAIALIPYGLEIDGWMFETYQEDFALTAFKWAVSEEEIQSEEDQDGRSFTYTRKMHRTFWDMSDFFDFVSK